MSRSVAGFLKNRVMNNPVEPKTCSRCGAPLTPGALQGLCPRCLLALNLGTQTEMAGGWPRASWRQASPAPEPPALDEIAQHFPGLEILELLGRGGMGAVYKARQKQLDRIVALKILPPGIGDDSAFAERFTREAKALAKLLHPNIVALFEFGQADGIYYLLMEYVDGVNLRATAALQPGVAARGAGHRAADLRRAAIRPRPGHRPPRHQAGEHPAGPPRAGEGG